ncbi:MAG: hypothetical protein K8T26_10035 [Lentisphaerae bacterium]|nr:hypothetical protein [Lentisphaerota bacterium]
MTQDWDIRPRSESCGTCQKAFTDQQPYCSCLVFGDQGYARQDFCLPCWNAHTPESAPRYSVWQGIFRSPPPPAEEALKKETAESLLRKLIEEQNPARQDAMFILAVMLERKKIFIERDVQVQDGQTTRVYEHRQTGETFVIRDPHLNLNELGQVQREVSELLGASKKSEPASAGEGAAAGAALAVAAAATAADDIPEAADDEDEMEEEDAVEDTDDESDEDVEQEEEEEEDEDGDEEDDEEDDDEDDEDEDEEDE